MRIFVYEHLTSGLGRRDGPGQPTDSMIREGLAMFQAVGNDLTRLAGVHLCAMCDAQLPAPRVHGADIQFVTRHHDGARIFNQLARSADSVLIIAPELGGQLLERTTLVENLGCHLLSPDALFVRITSDKLVTIQMLAKAGVPVPLTFHGPTREHIARLPDGPLVAKPTDGAGSYRVQLTDRDALMGSGAYRDAPCIQVFAPGRPASVGLLCGTARPICLPPCWQRICPPRFEYQGGEQISEPALIRRAQQLAQQALAALPPTRGYVGIDLILGDRDDGRDDVVIEINPRITTSYVGLRAVMQPNLGEAMWQTALGRPPRLSVALGQVEFDAYGAFNVKPQSALRDSI